MILIARLSTPEDSDQLRQRKRPCEGGVDGPDVSDICDELFV